jgi:chromosome segregation ATPase
MAVQFKVIDGKLVKITEAETSEEELRAELQAEADNAQNALNAAADELVRANQQLEEAQAAVAAAEANQEEAQQRVNFSTGRINEFNEAVALLSESDGEEAEGETTGESEAVPVDVHVAPTAAA